MADGNKTCGAGTNAGPAQELGDHANADAALLCAGDGQDEALAQEWWFGGTLQASEVARTQSNYDVGLGGPDRRR